jgi:MEMO1 family protein
MKKKINIILIILLSFLLSACQKADQYSKLKLSQGENNQKEENMTVRNPAVAGTFYPAQERQLKNEVEQFLNAAKVLQPEKSLRILIVPHAGFSYSGATAGWGFKQVAQEQYSTVYLLGSSHKSYFSQAAVYNSGVWKNPLGTMAIDEDLANGLINQSSLITANLSVHDQEHSLEVELPFLQIIYQDFKLVPILLGHSEADVLSSLSEAIVSQFDDSSLLVVSTDLSHYPVEDVAEAVDKQTIEAILSLDQNFFDQKINENLTKPGVETCACGADGVKVAIMVAEKLGYKEAKLIHYSNSGQTGGDKSRVVGYAAIGFYTDQKISPQPKAKLEAGAKLNQQQQNTLLGLARDTLQTYLTEKKVPDTNINDQILKQELGAFVTLRKNGQLRGCIGEFEAVKPLYRVVQEKVVDAAINDPRFSPVKASELDDLIIEISVLSPRQKIDNWQEIKLGQHGVVIKKGLRSGTYLPQVAEETGWSLEQFLQSLCSQKAGLSSNCYQDKSAELYIFTAQVFSEGEVN